MKKRLLVKVIPVMLAVIAVMACLFMIVSAHERLVKQSGNENIECTGQQDREIALLDSTDFEINDKVQNIGKDMPILIGEMPEYREFDADKKWMPRDELADDTEIAAL